MTAIISVFAFSYNISIEEQELKPYYSAVITIAMVILINQKLNDITYIVSEDYINKTTERKYISSGLSNTALNSLEL